MQGIKQLKMDSTVRLTDNIGEADALLALQSKLKKNSHIQAAAKNLHIPIYVTKVFWKFSPSPLVVASCHHRVY